MPRRLLLLGLAFLPVLLAAPASAKVPPFTIEVSSTTPRVGETVLITVRFWSDPEHTDPALEPDLGSFRGFLWAKPIGRAEVDKIPIDMRLVRPGMYRCRVVFPFAGRWALCSWAACRAHALHLPGYPNRPERVTVIAPSADPSVAIPGGTPSKPASGFPLPVVAATTVLFAIVAAARLIRSRRGGAVASLAACGSTS